MAMCDRTLVSFATSIKRNKFNNQWYIDFSKLEHISDKLSVIDAHKNIFGENLKKYLWLELDKQIKEKFVKEWEDLFWQNTDENWGE